ncbi:OLC1v1027987C1 [Oldenlandia corymbosa var. corymbosa]|uniref:OLC1v1027987C1 n=1 Tax=Oldenlandia corymbosa var. corymbosa TaxID=529605 RepID=A0AAV1CBF3_OLDCO|nr:OLC1v1027987C1 [Oldenlandia corymbosa var. corymbosa]
MAFNHIDNAGDDIGGGGGESTSSSSSSCVWFTCGVVVLSLALVMILATASSYSSSSAFPSAPLKHFPSFLNSHSAEEENGTASAVQKKSIIVSVSAAAKHFDDDGGDRARNSSVSPVPSLTKPRDELQILEKGLARARSLIRKSLVSAGGGPNLSSAGCIYHNPAEFFQ